MKPIGSPVAVATKMRMWRYLNIELKLRLGAVLPNVRRLTNPEDGFFTRQYLGVFLGVMGLVEEAKDLQTKIS